MNDRPDVSVVIVNWNVRDLLRACLSSLDRRPEDRAAIEVIVVDNASSDGSADMVRRERPGVRLIENASNVGFGRANNQALASCRARYVLLLNPDAEALPGAIDEMVGALEGDPTLGVVGARLENRDGSFQKGCGGALPTLANVAGHCLRVDRLLPRTWRPPALFYAAEEAARRPMQWVSGAAMMIRRTSIDERIFDERFFMYGEDMELCRRVRSAGLGVRLVPTARVLHHMSASMERQTSDEVHASLVKGPRAYFRMEHGRAALVAFDLIVLAGYIVRWLGFGVRSALRPGGVDRRRAVDSRRSAVAAARALFGR